jgi:nitrogen fixation/metabolism regulation signal transduction histidine kinase
MAPRGRIQRRLAAAIVLTALIPLLAATYLARSMVRQTTDLFFRPEIRAGLDQTLELYQALARAQKTAMRAQARAIAVDPGLRAAVESESAPALKRALARLFRGAPGLVSLTVEDAARAPLASVDRGRRVDPEKEYELPVEESLGDDEAPVLQAVFATDKAMLEGRDRIAQFIEFDTQLSDRRKADEQTNVQVFGVLLGFTILLAILVGTMLARSVSSRIEGLALATKRVGAGDLDTRVDEGGSDELAELARAFNRMLIEVQTSRARVEYLQRIGAWQDMARRLAHEIKNPLTPIQLAVEEIHERYDRSDAKYAQLLDATLEVVEAEVGTLRRLVGEFSDFARLPQAQLEESDLIEFLQEQSDRASLLEEELSVGPAGSERTDMDVSFYLPTGSACIYLDRQMMGRALNNLIRNAAQAISGTGRTRGKIEVRLVASPEAWLLTVDDDGPGVPAEVRGRLFDPYVTTKTEGTGLGLAIVKKIVVEHGGTIEALESPLGGARVQIALPRAEAAAGVAVAESPLVAASSRATTEVSPRNP